jgi:hypothetical protein
MTHDLRCAIRAIWSHRWFSAAVVFTLALGIGLNTMVFTLINAVLFKPYQCPAERAWSQSRARIFPSPIGTCASPIPIFSSLARKAGRSNRFRPQPTKKAF